MKSEGITKVITIQPQGNMTRFNGNQSNNCFNISLKTTNVNLVVKPQGI